MQKMHCVRDNFPTILAEFLLQFRCLNPLAEFLRVMVFPVMDDGTIWTGLMAML